MKSHLLSAMLLIASTTWAADQCETDCVTSTKQCAQMCQKSLKTAPGKKKTNPSQACQDKCKEFERECKQDCAAEKEKL